MIEPEILVHAAAPSRGSDDARYRKEAVSILQFEAAKRHDPLPRKVRTDNTGRKLHDQISQDAKRALNQDSITSTDPAPRHHLPDSLTTWVTPNLTRPSPQLLVGRTPAPLFYEKNSTRSENLQIKRTPADQYRPRTTPSAPVAIQETPHLRHSLSDSFETPPSVIPDSQPIPPLSQDRNKRTFEESSSSPSPTHRQPPSAKRTRSDEVEELERWTQPDDTSTPPLNNLPQPASSSSSPPIPSSPNLPPQITPTTTPPPKTTPPTIIHEDPQPTHYLRRRRQALPPRPKPTLQPFTTHLTPNLLSVRKATTKILASVTPRRALSPLERGHWRFTMAEDDVRWTRNAKEEMWGFLRNTIVAGAVGWGVWAVFEERRRVGDADADSSGGGGGGGGGGEREGEDEGGGDTTWQQFKHGGGEEGGDEEGGMGGTVKVYCWGEVVPEIWAVLFTATGRRIKRCGARWIDAGGNVVVDMG